MVSLRHPVEQRTMRETVPDTLVADAAIFLMDVTALQSTKLVSWQHGA